MLTFAIQDRNRSMTIYLFNPEHDIALASNLEHFTAPHAGRELRHDLGFLPTLWAERGSLVLVDDVGAAREALHRLGLATAAEIVDAQTLGAMLRHDDLQPVMVPWGWNVAVRQSLKGIGIGVGSMPSNARLNVMRQLSHRAWASEHLLKPLLAVEGTVGGAEVLPDTAAVRAYLSRCHDIVLKAPWSSSGRGIRYVSDMATSGEDSPHGITPHLEGWVRNVVNRQGCVMGEPYYNKVLDFGMEFESDGKGAVAYKGLSLFETVNGAYAGNVIDDEDSKLAFLSRYLPLSLVNTVRARAVELLSEAFAGAYAGPFGIDMMVVRTANGLALHPCVEMNLRMTMGHVALQLHRRLGLERHVMRIVYSNGRYNLKVAPL